MFLNQEHMEFPILEDIVDKLSKLIIMEKIIFCSLILIIIFLIYSYDKLKFKEFFDINLLGIEYDKRLYVGNQKDWSHKLKKGDLGVNGVTETNNYCIHVKNNNYGQNQNIDCLTQREVTDKIKRNYASSSQKICLKQTEAEIDALPHYSKDPDGLCITEHDAQFLKNIKPYLRNKVYEMRKRIIKSKPYCNWHGASISSTVSHEYGIYVCQDNMVTHYYPARYGVPNWRSDKLDD